MEREQVRAGIAVEDCLGQKKPDWHDPCLHWMCGSHRMLCSFL